MRSQLKHVPTECFFLKKMLVWSLYTSVQPIKQVQLYIEVSRGQSFSSFLSLELLKTS